MSASTYVQFIRNFLCVIKALFPTNTTVTWIPFPTLSEPFNRVTVMEYSIAITQFAAVYFNVYSGFEDFRCGYHNYYKYKKLLVLVDKYSLTVTTSTTNTTNSVANNTTTNSALTILRHGLESERLLAERKVISGVWEVIIGICFLFLFANSIHIHGPTHPKPLIDALIWMEIGLVYLLYLIVNSYQKNSSDSKKLLELCTIMNSNDDKDVNVNEILLHALSLNYDCNLMELLLTISPSYTPRYNNNDDEVTDDVIAHEISAISVLLNADGKSTGVKTRRQSNITEKALKILGISKETLTKTMEQKSIKLGYTSMYDIVYFIINIIAGYGYMMGIMVYYFPTGYLSNSYESLCSMVLLNLTRSDADWYGNFAGDFAWMVEPIVVLTNAYILNKLMNSNKVSLYVYT